MDFEQRHSDRTLDFERRVRRSYSKRLKITLHTIKVEVSKLGLNESEWSETGVIAGRLLIFPSTSLRITDLLKPRKKVIIPSKHMSVEIMCYKEDINLAREIANATILKEFQRQKSDIEMLERFCVN